MAIVKALGAHLNAPDPTLEDIRPVPTDWDPAGVFPAAYTIVRGTKTVRRAFGAYLTLRGDGGYAKTVFFGALTTGDPRWHKRAYEHLKAGTDAQTVKGGVNTTASDGLLSHAYGTSGAGNVVKESATVLPLEASLQGGRAAYARLSWEAYASSADVGVPKDELLREVDRWRASLRLHHMVRWGRFFRRVTPDNPEGWPSEENPGVTGRNFAHSDLEEAEASKELAVIETEMYKRGMRAPVKVSLPGGFTHVLSLSKGTSDRPLTHPGWKHACAIVRRFVNPKRIHTFYGSDIRDPEMRRLYGETGCTIWDQSTTAPRFTANSGYNSISFTCLVMLEHDGVLTAVLGSREKADAWLKAVAGGCSVGMLPERLVEDGKTSYVFDDPLNSRESRQFLWDGRPVRRFGGTASGTATDDAHEWSFEPYGVLAPWDPADRIGPVTKLMDEHAARDPFHGKNTLSRAGGLVSRLYNEAKRGRAFA